jgi:hypothetical protein
MNHLGLFAVAFAILTGSLNAQQTSDVHQRTASPPNARFEIVQSELAAKWTFRLDRFTGHVAQLTVNKLGENVWEEMQVIGISQSPAPLRAHFQIFTSGIAAKHTFMIDTDTGKTWVVTSSKGKNDDGTEYDINRWEPFAD